MWQRARAHELIFRLRWVMAAAIMTLVAGAADGGDIRGLVTGPANVRRPAEPKTSVGDAVVWVTGIRAPTVPQDKPLLAQRSMQFAPQLLVVVAGQTVDMPNEDDMAHNVFSDSLPKRFNLGIYSKEETKSVTFGETGLVEVRCSLHRRMNARILVVPNSYYAVAAVGGDFLIKGVPAGRYTVMAWKQGGVETSQEITVPAQGEVVGNFSIPRIPQE